MLDATGHCPNLSAPGETIDGDPGVRLTPDAELLEQSAEDLYEHAPCGYLSTPRPTARSSASTRRSCAGRGYARDELVGRRASRTC